MCSCGLGFPTLTQKHMFPSIFPPYIKKELINAILALTAQYSIKQRVCQPNRLKIGLI